LAPFVRFVTGAKGKYGIVVGALERSCAVLQFVKDYLRARPKLYDAVRRFDWRCLYNRSMSRLLLTRSIVANFAVLRLMTRRERLAAGGFVAALVLAPALFTELFPFTRVPMYRDALPRQFHDYRVVDPNDEQLPPRKFGLHSTYLATPPDVGFGFLPPPGLAGPGEPPDDREITSWVRERMTDADPPYVEVVQEVTGPIDDRRVGVVSSRRIRVTNPLQRVTP
jgi:hypothetical protein